MTAQKFLFLHVSGELLWSDGASEVKVQTDDVSNRKIILVRYLVLVMLIVRYNLGVSSFHVLSIMCDGEVIIGSVKTIF